MAEWQKVAKQIARDICKDNKICTCNEKDGHCISVMTIAERLAKQGYKPPRTKKKNLKTSNWLTKGMTEEQFQKIKTEAIKQAEEELARISKERGGEK